MLPTGCTHILEEFSTIYLGTYVTLSTEGGDSDDIGVLAAGDVAGEASVTATLRGEGGR